MAPAGGRVLWLHGSGQTGEESRAQVGPYFSAPELASVRLSFPTAPTASIPCYGGEVITAWFGIPEVPITARTARDEKEVLKAVERVHKILDREVAAGTSPSNIFVCGLSQGGALAIASVLLYPETLGGCVVFSGSLPLSKSFAERIPSEATKQAGIFQICRHQYCGFMAWLTVWYYLKPGMLGVHFYKSLACIANSRFIPHLDIHWWMKSSSIFANGLRIVYLKKLEFQCHPYLTRRIFNSCLSFYRTKGQEPSPNFHSSLFLRWILCPLVSTPIYGYHFWWYSGAKKFMYCHFAGRMPCRAI